MALVPAPGCACTRAATGPSHTWAPVRPSARPFPFVRRWGVAGMPPRPPLPVQFVPFKGPPGAPVPSASQKAPARDPTSNAVPRRVAPSTPTMKYGIFFRVVVVCLASAIMLVGRLKGPAGISRRPTGFASHNRSVAAARAAAAQSGRGADWGPDWDSVQKLQDQTARLDQEQAAAPLADTARHLKAWRPSSCQTSLPLVVFGLATSGAKNASGQIAATDVERVECGRAFMTTLTPSP